MGQHESEVQTGQRFAFGENWQQFLRVLTDERIARAQLSLQTMLEVESLAGKTFLDIGCGSGLFSLAARNLNARVHSFDFDPQSVACTEELKRRYAPADEVWIIERGSVLDVDYLASLGTFDVVYSWGVLHHTGQMWQAIDNAAARVAPAGKFFIAIYNDQGPGSRGWLRVKQLYNRLPHALRWAVLYPSLMRLWAPTMLRDLLRGRPGYTWRHYAEQSTRGMSAWHDVVDWVGGLPFEVASPEKIVAHCEQLGFRELRHTDCGRGLGCNEFVFERSA
ncbi:class I SAM-dependent methyltransferase [Anatilimnocola sp. NA78]|uniref:class I SAM-dependent methyltransferase n=1 Tax=Anatilimnocola sp. NA78 TaxID=3415683 RepID=UPI003CE4D970